MEKKQRYVKTSLWVLLILFACGIVSGAETGDTALPECEEHSYEALVVPATVEADGYTAKKCSVCMQETEKEIIKKIGTVELDKTVYHFYDSKIYPDLHVWDANGEINPADGYTVKKPSDPRKPGTYNYVVTFFGKYKGTVTLSYTIENPVSTPVLKSVSSTSKGVKIIWNKVEGARYCIVYRKEGTGSWAQIAKVKDACEYVDSAALYGKTYTYTVKGRGYSYGAYVDSDYDKKGLTAKVNSVWTPDAPAITLKNKQAVIKWNKVAGATQYRIYRSASKKGEYKLIYTHKKGSLSYTDKNVKAGQNYYYKICAYNGLAASKLSSYTKIYITLATPVFNKKVTSTPSSVTFGWKAVKDADYYVVYRKKKINDSWKKIATVKSSEKLEYTDKTNTLYRYSIRAYEKISSKKTIKSAMSETHGLSNMGKPKIREIKIGGSDRWVTLTSEFKNTPTNYQLYCKVGEKGKWKKIETGYTGAYIGDRMEYNENGAVSFKELELNKTYYFKIRGYSQKGDLVQYGPYSDVKSVKLYYNPKVTVTLPKKDFKNSSLPVTIKNNGSKTLRMYADGSEVFGGYKNLKVVIAGSEGAKAVNGEYIDIPAGKTVKVYFLGRGSNVDYTKQTAVLLKFRYNNSEYYSAYSYAKGKIFENN